MCQIEFAGFSKVSSLVTQSHFSTSFLSWHVTFCSRMFNVEFEDMLVEHVFEACAELPFYGDNSGAGNPSRKRPNGKCADKDSGCLIYFQQFVTLLCIFVHGPDKEKVSFESISFLFTPPELGSCSLCRYVYVFKYSVTPKMVC